MVKIILPEIPQSFLIMLLLISLVVMRMCGIDTFVTAGLSAISGYLLGIKLEQTRQTPKSC
jgi:hypothetical protein